MSAWQLTSARGEARVFHAADPAVDPCGLVLRAAVVHSVDRRTLVLGSSQRVGVVDSAVAGALDVEVVHRRSGGGAVLLVPDEFLWLDVVVPAGDPLWSDDVGEAMVWVGQWWCRALARVGIAGQVHRGPLVASPWSQQVCWAGVGAGEVVAADGAKLVGVSQRRTRTYARLQTMCHLRWRPEWVSALVAAPRPLAGELSGVAAVAQCTAGDLQAALAATAPN